jgi:hypothetical protein
MALIRSTKKLPSGIDGWYIYHHVDGGIVIFAPNGAKHTAEDLEYLRELLLEGIRRIEDE